jgi:hypothetical protein
MAWYSGIVDTFKSYFGGKEKEKPSPPVIAPRADPPPKTPVVVGPPPPLQLSTEIKNWLTDQERKKTPAQKAAEQGKQQAEQAKQAEREKAIKAQQADYTQRQREMTAKFEAHKKERGRLESNSNKKQPLTREERLRMLREGPTRKKPEPMQVTAPYDPSKPPPILKRPPSLPTATRRQHPPLPKTPPPPTPPIQAQRATYAQKQNEMTAQFKAHQEKMKGLKDNPGQKKPLTREERLRMLREGPARKNPAPKHTTTPPPPLQRPPLLPTATKPPRLPTTPPPPIPKGPEARTRVIRSGEKKNVPPQPTSSVRKIKRQALQNNRGLHGG